MNEAFEIIEKYEGLWRVTWDGLAPSERGKLLSNLMPLVFSIAKNSVGFSTGDGSLAYTMYFHPITMLQKNSCPDLIKVGNVKCCMFTDRNDAEQFVDTVSKELMWKRLTEKNEEEDDDDDDDDF